MAFDGIVTKAIASEIQNLSGARIDKVFEPNKNQIIIGMYLKGKNYALNICIDAQNGRIHLTTHSKANPKIAPNFCMLLRKHLIGLHLKNVVTFNLERVVILEFEGIDDFEDIVSKKLVVELMGKHGNIILLEESNIILDSLRHTRSNDDKTTRDIYPHSKYSFPLCNKHNFLDVSAFDEFLSILQITNETSLDDLPKIISNKFNGISKVFIQSIILELKINMVSNTNIELIFNYIKNIINNITSDNLYFKEILNEKSKKDYFLVPKENNFDFALNFFIDDFYYNKESLESFKTYRDTTFKLILSVLKKYKTRLININDKLDECKNMDLYKLYGELITANLYKIKSSNVDFIEVENYYDNNNLIKIPLDKKYSPNINAKKYYKKYNKLKNTLEIVTVQKQETLESLNYIESIVYELESAKTVQDVVDVFEEISENELFKDFIKNKNNKKIKKGKLTKNKTVSFNPIKYNIDNYTILVGRNNKENDYLTLKYANKQDIWFHAKDIHGSHVILRCDSNVLPNISNINNEVLIQCAKLAVKHSKAKNSSNVPVDYCLVKYVKKPKGAKPGMVIYTNNKTLYV